MRRHSLCEAIGQFQKLGLPDVLELFLTLLCQLRRRLGFPPEDLQYNMWANAQNRRVPPGSLTLIIRMTFMAMRDKNKSQGVRDPKLRLTYSQ